MKPAYGPNVAPSTAPPPAPLDRSGLSPSQREALVLIFFAGEMNRSRQFFVAEGSRSILGMTVNVLHRKGMVKLGCERRKSIHGSVLQTFRYYVSLTPRGEWYATTLVRQREANVSALEPDNFEDSPTVYAEEPEPEVEANRVSRLCSSAREKLYDDHNADD